MNIQNRNKDLTQVFDQRWKANHNYEAVKQAKEHDKNFIDKMFNKNKEEKPKQNINYMQERLKRLNDNMSTLRNNRNKF